jgi:hypothetical protein
MTSFDRFNRTGAGPSSPTSTNITKEKTMETHVLMDLLQDMGWCLLAVVIVTGVIFLFRRKGETAHVFKGRTILFLIATCAFAQMDFRVVTIPFFVFMAWHSYRAGVTDSGGRMGLFSLIDLFIRIFRSVVVYLSSTPVRIVDIENHDDKRDYWGRRSKDYDIAENSFQALAMQW